MAKDTYYRVLTMDPGMELRGVEDYSPRKAIKRWRDYLKEHKVKGKFMFEIIEVTEELKEYKQIRL